MRTSSPPPQVGRFLNRLLGLTIGRQEMLFAFFSNLVDLNVKQARREGKYDEGVLEVKGRSIAIVDETTVDEATDDHGALVAYRVRVDRGTPFAIAQATLEQASATSWNDMEGHGLDEATLEQRRRHTTAMAPWRLRRPRAHVAVTLGQRVATRGARHRGEVLTRRRTRHRRHTHTYRPHTAHTAYTAHPHASSHTPRVTTSRRHDTGRASTPSTAP